MKSNPTVQQYSMRRYVLLLVLAAAALTATACGDPIVVLGESPGTVRNVVGIGDSSGTRRDSIATRSRFLTLSAVAFDDGDNLLYVADRGSTRVVSGITTPIGRLFSVTSAGRLQLLLDGGGCSTGGVCLVEATNMIIAPGRRLIIADALANRVFQFDVATRVMTTLAGTGAAANAIDGGVAASSALNQPSSVVRAGDGTLYIAEQGGTRVLRIGTDGVYRIIAGGGASSIGTSPTAATAARLGRPSGLALDNGVLYIADRQFAAVYALTISTGQIARIAGDGVSGFAGDAGLAVDARLQSPTDLDLTPNGRILYIADTGNNRVRTVNLATGLINTYMGSGSTVYNGDHVAAGAVSLKVPVALATSTLGFLFVVDQGHHVVRRATTAF